MKHFSTHPSSSLPGSPALSSRTRMYVSWSLIYALSTVHNNSNRPHLFPLNFTPLLLTFFMHCTSLLSLSTTPYMYSSNKSPLRYARMKLIPFVEQYPKYDSLTTRCKLFNLNAKECFNNNCEHCSLIANYLV